MATKTQPGFLSAKVHDNLIPKLMQLLKFPEQPTTWEGAELKDALPNYRTDYRASGGTLCVSMMTPWENWEIQGGTESLKVTAPFVISWDPHDTSNFN